VRLRLNASVRASLLALLTAAVFISVSLAAPSPAPGRVGAGAARAPLPGTASRPLPRLIAQQAQLTATDGAQNDRFGYGVAIAGDTAVVGADGDDVGVNGDQGSAYVFVRSGTTWSLQAQLTAADGDSNDGFGRSVAIAGETIVVGAPRDDVGGTFDQGSAYVFVRSGTTWSQEAKLTAADGATSDGFGWSVAVAGDTAVAGARDDDVGANTDQGSAYVFARSGTVWSQQEKLITADGAFASMFGASVAVEDDTVVVGAYGDPNGANAMQGSAYVFVHNALGWPQEAQLTADDGASFDYFGFSVALSGETVVVGARDDDVGANTDQGSAYVFVRSSGTWTQQTHLIATDGRGSDMSGYAVALAGETAVVSAPSGDLEGGTEQGWACVFGRRDTTWSQDDRLAAGDGATSDNFGYSVALCGGTAVVGVPYDTVDTVANRGSVTVFTGVLATPARPTPKSPKGLISSRTPTFRWSAVAGAATYQVRVYRGSRLIRAKTGIATTSWKVAQRLPRGVRLTWKVRAVNASGAGVWSTRPWFKVR
jgi:hypothetical protein